MIPRTEPALTLHRRRDRDGVTVDDRKRRRLLDAGLYVAVAPGSLAPAGQWEALLPIDRHYLLVVEVADRVHGPLLLCGSAAAAVWGIDRIGAWPTRVDTIVPRTTGGRSSGGLRRRTRTMLDSVTVPWRGHELTTPAQTALDLAAESAFTDGVIAIDQVRWRRREEGPLATFDELSDLLDSQRRRRGHGRVEAALAFSTDLSDSVRETHSRVLIHRLGFPPPELQKRFSLPSGRVADSDFYFAEWDHAAEFDGVGKYIDPALLKGRSSQQALIDEKDRGDELRRMVQALSRWRTPALKDPRMLYDVLSGDGLPACRPRPPHGLVLR